MHANQIKTYKVLPWYRACQEIALKFLYVQQFGQRAWGLVLMGACLGMRLYGQQWEAACMES